MAIYANLSIDQGSDFSEELKIQDMSGEPADLAGYTIKSEIRRTISSETKYDFVCTVTNASLGVVIIGLPAATSNAMRPGRYLYDVEIKNNSSDIITRVIEGQVEITGGITRSL